MTLLLFLLAAACIVLTTGWLGRPIERLSLVAVVLLPVLFLLPGFLANRLASFYSTSPERRPSAYDSTLSSLAVSIAVLFAEAVLATIALLILWLAFRGTFDALDLDIFAKQGLTPYFRAQPVLFAATAGSAGLLAYVLAGAIGYFNVVASLLRPRLAKLELTADDMWTMALTTARQEANMEHSYLEIVMKDSRDIFRGVARGFSFRTSQDGTKDLVLEDATYIPQGDVSKQTKFRGPPPGLAILNSQNIESIRVIFTN